MFSAPFLCFRHFLQLFRCHLLRLSHYLRVIRRYVVIRPSVIVKRPTALTDVELLLVTVIVEYFVLDVVLPALGETAVALVTDTVLVAEVVIGFSREPLQPPRKGRLHEGICNGNNHHHHHHILHRHHRLLRRLYY